MNHLTFSLRKYSKMVPSSLLGFLCSPPFLYCWRSWMVLKMVFKEYLPDLKNCHEVILKVRSNINTHLCRHHCVCPASASLCVLASCHRHLTLSQRKKLKVAASYAYHVICMSLLNSGLTIHAPGCSSEGITSATLILTRCCKAPLREQNWTTECITWTDRLAPWPYSCAFS